MRPQVKEALLWGVIGLLTFLVLLQGYEIVQGVGVDLPLKAGAAALVGVASAAITYLASDRVEDVTAVATEGESAPEDGADERTENETS